ncbi:MAG: polysaccharide pyruvyl transferase CsaB [Chloroherpetonaceae bacterium]|nr:polysaccharide pyruvyl transferase CsaB [Chthonomonadaceae bacterium]MDW8208164.1 polysaccharide pyruvyl transferase CsaB [Chloroherpetonaceae bacterium]
MRFVLSGYYGFGNAGDEAVLAGIREAFAQRAGGRVELIALAHHPEETARLHGIETVDRMNLPAMRRTIRESDLLISGGGSLLQDATSVRSLLYYLWVARIALSHQVPVMFYAQGIGPLRRSISRSLVRIVANRCACITVRDEASASLLRSIGVTRPPIEVTADPAFALRPASAEIVDAVFRAEGLSPADAFVGVALRAWGHAESFLIPEYARLLTALSARCGARVLLLPMHVPQDVVFAERVAQATGRPEAYPVLGRPYPPQVLLGLVGRMQAVVAMRLHALIFAARMGVPPFALAYDPKVTGLMEALGMRDAMEHWREFDPERVADRVAAGIVERPERVAALCARLPDLEERALRNADRALGLFAHGAVRNPLLTLRF